MPVKRKKVSRARLNCNELAVQFTSFMPNPEKAPNSSERWWYFRGWEKHTGETRLAQTAHVYRLCKSIIPLNCSVSLPSRGSVQQELPSRISDLLDMSVDANDGLPMQVLQVQASVGDLGEHSAGIRRISKFWLASLNNTLSTIKFQVCTSHWRSHRDLNSDLWIQSPGC